MARRIELTIDTSFVSDWTTKEGLREMLQNGLDAQDEYGALLRVDWTPGYGGTVRISNEGSTIPLEALLLGHTTKRDRDELRGQYGEGLKLGTLALLRGGHKVVIRNGSDVWRPALEQSKTFDAEVVAFYIESGRKAVERVSVEVQGVDKDTWTGLSTHFRFLTEEPEDSVVQTHAGTLLLSPEQKGRIFIKGILVETDPEYRYGYDLRNANVDRDRKMVNRWDLQWETSRIWNLAMGQRPDLLDPFYKFLSASEPPKDVEGIGNVGSHHHLSEEISAQLAQKFTEQFGERAVPVASLSESREVEHLAAKGIVASAPLRKALEQSVGTVETVKAKLSQEKATSYGWHDLSWEERGNLEDAITLVATVVEGVSLDMIDVVDFRSGKFNGMYHHKTGRIDLAKSILSDPRSALKTLVHEVAHHVAEGSDGTVDHVRAIEGLWADIAMLLLTR
jgi:hypothetical protein